MARTQTPPTPWWLGPQWTTRRFAQPGWAIAPLRLFLGVTFIVAAMDKLTSSTYFDTSSPLGVKATMAAIEHSSPIGPLVGLSLHAPLAVGLVIALGELAVGLGVLTGLFTRVAAVGGAILAASFFLTVSWNTTPYYYGSDIVFLFAFSALALLGSGGVVSLDAWRADRARRDAGMTSTQSVTLSADRVRALCGKAENCSIGADVVCHGEKSCALSSASSASTGGPELDRRTLVRGGQAAAGLAVVGGLAAAAGRLSAGRAPAGTSGALGGSTPTPTSSPSSAAPTPAASASQSASAVPTSSGPSLPAGEHVVGTVAQLPVGQAASFTDPASGRPANVLRTSASDVVAFSAVCTHAGCTVGFNAGASPTYVCPCHGSVYNALTGAVEAGPAPSPLPAVKARIVGNDIVVD